jgi:hypothetical protein
MKHIFEVEHPLEKLTAFLNETPEGEVKPPYRLGTLLCRAWGWFKGSDASGMSGEKMRKRLEAVEWHPPVVSFTLVRHGKIFAGSNRADLQRWHVDVEALTARHESAGQRELAPAACKQSPRKTAEEIAKKILAGTPDERLKWHRDGSVKVLLTDIFPMGDKFHWPVVAHRNKFMAALGETLECHNWFADKFGTFHWRMPRGRRSFKK